MQQQKHDGFTLVEVLISITLLSLVLLALYQSSDIMRDSNKKLFNHLTNSSKTLQGSKTLYMDLMHADHNISIVTEENFHRLTIARTSHSLYGLGQAKVMWLVYKTDNTLLRVEGGKYNMPLKNDDRVEVDVIAKNLELFKVYKSKKKDKILAMIQIKGQEPQLFMSQNIPSPPPKVKENNNTNPPPNNGVAQNPPPVVAPKN
jgi:prepilin-type N-terminal cleavage/methylation domain-containing protein